MDPRPPAPTPTALVVDDDRDLLALTARGLSRSGWRVLSAEGAEDALDLVGADEVDVVLTDVVMPEVDGLELAARLRRTHPTLPVVFTTGHDDPEIHLAVARTGAPLIRKPSTPAAIDRTLRDALDGADPTPGVAR